MKTKNKLEKGLEFEEKIYEWLLREKNISCKKNPLQKQPLGENAQGIEIKNDQRFNETGNLFISTNKIYGNKTIGWGIYKDDNSWLYIIGDENTFWIFTCRQLQNFQKENKVFTKVVKHEKGSEVGFLLPISKANKIAPSYSINQLTFKL